MFFYTLATIKIKLLFMKKALTLLTAIVILATSFASVPIPVESPKLKAAEIVIPVGNTGKTISLLELSKIGLSDFETLTGHHLNFFQRLNFSVAQHKLKKGINKDGTLNNKLTKFFTKRDGDTGFHLGGFALGFFLGAIGIVIAYVINDDFKSNRVKWAWIGFGTFLVLYLVLVIAIINSNI